MDDEVLLHEDEIQQAHKDRELEVHEPLYGLAPEPGGGGPESVGDVAQPRVEVPVEEPAEPGDTSLNLTWGIVFGGVLLLFVLVAVLYVSLGNTYSSAPFTTYPDILALLMSRDLRGEWISRLPPAAMAITLDKPSGTVLCPCLVRPQAITNPFEFSARQW